jgi:hypothetical protein
VAGKSTARLPRAVRAPFRVFVNGVEQRVGEDYTVEDGDLVFNRSLAQEGKLGFWRWALMLFGVAGSYRKHENVDVQYTLNGRPQVATGLEVTTPKRARSGQEGSAESGN